MEENISDILFDVFKTAHKKLDDGEISMHIVTEQEIAFKEELSRQFLERLKRNNLKIIKSI